MVKKCMNTTINTGRVFKEPGLLVELGAEGCGVVKRRTHGERGSGWLQGMCTCVHVCACVFT